MHICHEEILALITAMSFASFGITRVRTLWYVGRQRLWLVVMQASMWMAKWTT